MIERYLAATGMPPSRFGRAAVRDPRLVRDLKDGREPGHALVARVTAYIAATPPGPSRG